MCQEDKRKEKDRKSTGKTGSGCYHVMDVECGRESKVHLIGPMSYSWDGLYKCLRGPCSNRSKKWVKRCEVRTSGTDAGFKGGGRSL